MRYAPRLMLDDYIKHSANAELRLFTYDDTNIWEWIGHRNLLKSTSMIWKNIVEADVCVCVDMSYSRIHMHAENRVSLSV